MSFSVSLKIVKEGMTFRNEVKKDSLFIGECNLDLVGRIPRMLSRTIENAIYIPVTPYNLKIYSIHSVAVLIDDVNAKYIASLTEGLEVLSSEYIYNYDGYHFSRFNDTQGIILKYLQ